ncbi:hypothetical protein ES702_07621 [subsurface metagenome]
MSGSYGERVNSIWINIHAHIGIIVADKNNPPAVVSLIKTELEKKYIVDLLDDDDIDAGSADLEVYDLIFVAGDITDMTKINELTTLGVPIATGNPEVALTILRMGDDSGGSGTSWGTAAGQTQVNIVDNTHQITLTKTLGNNTTYTAAGNINWVRASDLVVDAVELAEISGDNTKSALVVLPYDAPDEDGNPAPMPRVFWGMGEGPKWNGTTETMFYAMLDWLLHQGRRLIEVQGLGRINTIRNMIGTDFVTARNVYDYLVTGTTGAAPFEVIAEQEIGSVMERLQWLKNAIRKGTGTVLPANKSLYDLICLDRLDHGTYGLAALGVLITAVGALIAALNDLSDAEVWAYATRTLTDPDSYKADVSALALEATLSTHDSDIKTLLAALNDLSDAEVWAYATRTLTSHAFPFTNPAAALDVSNIRTAAYTLLTNGTYGLSALNTDLDKLLTGIIQGTGTVLPANKSLYDILFLDKNADESDSFLWDTSAYTTVETDISALFATALTGTTRRKYWVYLDMTGPAGDAAAWTEVIVKVQVKIDGSNYRTIAKSTKEKTDLASTAEPGIPIEVPMVAQDVKITLQFDVALAGDQTIYYHWVQEKMEY